MSFSAEIKSINNIRCQIDKQIFQYAIYNNKAELFIQDIETSTLVSNTSFIFTINSLMRVLADAQVLYYDMQNQTLDLKMQDTMSSMPLISSGYGDAFNNGSINLNRTYSCAFVDSSDILQFTTSIIVENNISVSYNNLYSHIRYYQLS